MTSTLDRLRNDRRVEHVDDERSCGNGIIITMKAGWTFDPCCDNRVAGADTVTEARELLRSAKPYSGELTD